MQEQNIPFFSEHGPLFFSVGTRFIRSGRIIPVFLPFAGCPRHCVFCAQDRQTGSPQADIATILGQAAHQLSNLPAQSSGVELAFYGGTFTSLPADTLDACLRLFSHFRQTGVLTHGRCSTRPDAATPAPLARLRQAGIGLVELGVQSFDDQALALSKRGYDGHTAEQGCRAVQDAGLLLGVQLLPGMPGVTPQIFLDDVRQALALRPACLRFYPCLVPEGTPLAAMWRSGTYTPWTQEETVAALGEGLRMAWEARIPVIRLSVAPEDAFEAIVLAGPRHPALGSLIQAEALRRCVDSYLARLGRPPTLLRLPRACQGYIYGDKGVLKTWWTSKGLGPNLIRFDGDEGLAALY